MLVVSILTIMHGERQYAVHRLFAWDQQSWYNDTLQLSQEKALMQEKYTPEADKDRRSNEGSDLPDDFSHYVFYRYISPGDGPDIGIRVLIDKNDCDFRIETINPENGESQNSASMSYDIDQGIYVRDSTEEEFNRLNAERAAWTRAQKMNGPKEP
jgi:hypothetical protein